MNNVCWKSVFKNFFKKRFKECWARSDFIFGLLNKEENAFLQKPINLRHPFIFYVGKFTKKFLKKSENSFFQIFFWKVKKPNNFFQK